MNTLLGSQEVWEVVELHPLYCEDQKGSFVYEHNDPILLNYTLSITKTSCTVTSNLPRILLTPVKDN